jgi:hypothetical protein
MRSVKGLAAKTTDPTSPVDDGMSFLERFGLVPDTGIMTNKATWTPGQTVRVNYEVQWTGPTGDVIIPAPAQSGWMVESFANLKK